MGAPDRLFSPFIPKDQVGEAVAWEFEPLDGPAPPRTRERPMSERDRLPYERGLKDGYAAGHAAAMAEKDLRLGQLQRQVAHEMGATLESLRRALAELEGEAGEQVLQLALAIARQVVRREVEVDRAAVLPALHEAVAAVIDQQAHPRVHLNPQDLALLRDALEADGLLKGCRLIADAAITRGGCRVETAHSDIDATLETRWQRVLAAVGIDPRRAPRAPAPSPSPDARDDAGAGDEAAA